jgi:hypothetical protein
MTEKIEYQIKVGELYISADYSGIDQIWLSARVHEIKRFADLEAVDMVIKFLARNRIPYQVVRITVTSVEVPSNEMPAL